MKVESKILAGFIVTAVTLGGAGWLTYRATENFTTTQGWVTHTQEVISQLETTLATLIETDTEQRGYLLTDDENFLAQRQAAAAQLPVELQRIQQLTIDNPTQQQAVKNLEALVEKEERLADDRIAIFQRSGLQAAFAQEPMGKTEEGLNEVRAMVEQMQATEEKLRASRQEKFSRLATQTEEVIITGSVIAVIIGWIIVLMGRRELQLRALAEARLKENEERVRLMVAAVKDYAIFLLDPAGKVASWNDGARQIKGYTAEEIIGQNFSRFYPPEAREAGLPNQLLREATEKGRFEDIGWRVRKDGSQFWAHVVATAVRNPEGNLLGYVKVTQDLTERRRAEQVQKERDRYFELSREMICVLGFDGHFKTLNPAWKWTLGFPIEELLLLPFIEFVHPDDREATMVEVEKLTHGNELIYFENRYRCKDGSYRWIAWSARAGIPEQMIYGTGRDITERKQGLEKIEQLNEDLQRHARQLETSNKELEAFSYSVSHDLRAPLRHIDGYVGMLTKQSGEKLDERGRRYLHIIADSAQQMGTLIDDLLVFSRMSRTELHHANVSTEALVHEAVEALQAECNGRQIQWKIDALPDVNADGAMLQQVWVNLISNAIKYTRPRQPAEIEIGCRDWGNGEYIFFVQDNGVGFDMQYAHKLFGVFQRLHRPEEFEGTGIGLANVSRIIHRHGGRAWAEGKPNAGATFYFSLPKKTTETKN
jgi:PAS domain S-box-containing protein